MPSPAGSPDLSARRAIVASAAEHDNRWSRELCANVQTGEIVIFDLLEIHGTAGAKDHEFLNCHFIQPFVFQESPHSNVAESVAVGRQ